ncbi:MAG: DHA2 family efflux MFS transporter permease subunit [Acidobacteria bacterium]|nr:DHA2 family efflux MFS transporter permease subunit [Acidobacteriota bacterium]
MKPLITIVAIATAIFMVNLDASIVNVALPTLCEDFHTGTREAADVVMFYLVALCASLLIFGRLGDLLGKRAIFLAGYVVFTVGSVACGLAPGFGALLAGRLIQGLGGAMLLATSMALVVENLPPDRTGRAFGLITVFSGIGYSLGAPLGGVITEFLSWRWIFLINLLPGIAGAWLSGRTLTRKKSAGTSPKDFDAAGAVLSVIALVAFVFGLNAMKADSVSSVRFLVLAGTFLAALAVFLFREHRFPQPLVDLRLFKDPRLVLGMASSFLVITLLAGLVFLLPFFLELAMRFTTEKSGLLIGIFPLITLLAAPLAGWLSDRFGSPPVCATGTVLVLAAMLVLLQLAPGTGTPFLVLSLVFYGFGHTTFTASNANLVMKRAPPGKEGVTSSLYTEATFMASAIGVSLFEWLFSVKTAGLAGADPAAQQATVAGGFHFAVGVAGVLAALALAASLAVVVATPRRDDAPPLE